MTASRLSIVIPTYNRPAELRETLLRLRPQLTEACDLTVLDNCSSMKLETVVAEAGLLSLENVRVVRHPANIGMSANILRSFEVATAEWLIVLGDDDEITEDFVSQILRGIAAHDQAIFMNFSSSLHNRKQEFQTNGLEEFVRGMDNWSNVLFISCSVFHRRKMLPYLRFGFIYIYSLAPYVAMLLELLGKEGGVVVFSDKLVVRYKDNDAQTWSRILLGNVVLLLELLPTDELRRILFQKIQPYLLPLGDIAEKFVSDGTTDHRFEFYLRRMFSASMCAFGVRYLRAPVWQLLVDHPRWGSLFFRVFPRKRRHLHSSTDLHSGI